MKYWKHEEARTQKVKKDKKQTWKFGCNEKEGKRSKNLNLEVNFVYQVVNLSLIHI